MRKEFITKNSKETQKLGEMLAGEIKNGQVICLSGELGSGKTTFTQGLLKGLKIKGPYTSPTFLIIKNYKKEFPISKSQFPNKSQNPCLVGRQAKYKIQNIYHIDTYRVTSQDILNLGWEEIIGSPENIVIIEWADKVCDIIPKKALWVSFEWQDENMRKISFKSKG